METKEAIKAFIEWAEENTPDAWWIYENADEAVDKFIEQHETPSVGKSEGEEAEMFDWNNRPMDFYIKHLENEFRLDSSGTAKAVYELIQAFQQLSAATRGQKSKS